MRRCRPSLLALLGLFPLALMTPPRSAVAAPIDCADPGSFAARGFDGIRACGGRPYAPTDPRHLPCLDPDGLEQATGEERKIFAAVCQGEAAALEAAARDAAASLRRSLELWASMAYGFVPTRFEDNTGALVHWAEDMWGEKGLIAPLMRPSVHAIFRRGRLEGAQLSTVWKDRDERREWHRASLDVSDVTVATAEPGAAPTWRARGVVTVTVAPWRWTAFDPGPAWTGERVEAVTVSLTGAFDARQAAPLNPLGLVIETLEEN